LQKVTKGLPLTQPYKKQRSAEVLPVIPKTIAHEKKFFLSQISLKVFYSILHPECFLLQFFQRGQLINFVELFDE